ncbi:MAG TPA: DUF4097 family beta strand repeat-containing protein [Pyrinomonadaceae bacterium]|nr:DUF4097 family beta strand repeat-containing protein [Pyrinomonadaceae bacterium]
MGRRLITTAFLGFVVLLGAATAARAQDGDEGQLTKEFSATYPLAPDGRVRLKNINGRARVTAWERPEIRIEAVKRAHTQRRLDEVNIDVQATADSVQIKTVYPTSTLNFERGSRDNPAAVDYVLTVPRQARLESIELVNGPLELEGLAGEIRAALVNGQLTARNLAGDARLTTVNGRLEAEFDRLAAGTVALSSVNGEVSVRLPAEADATLRANTVHGSISNNLGLPVRRGRYVGQSLAGQLGAGSGRVKLDNVNGSIQIDRAPGGSPATNLLGDVSDADSNGPPAPPTPPEPRRTRRP